MTARLPDSVKVLKCAALCVCLASSLAACTETPSANATDAGSNAPDATLATIDASVSEACTPGAEPVAQLGSYWTAFVSRGTPNNPDELWAVRIDSGQADAAIKLSGPIVDGGRVQSSPLDDLLPFQWSADGNWLAYLARQDDRSIRELYVADMSTNPPGPARKANGYVVDGGNVVEYALSPDSSKLAYIADEDVDNVGELYVVDLNQPTLISQKVNGTFSALSSTVQRFQWSFDSKHIAYVANEDDLEKIDLYLADVSSGMPAPRLKITALGAEQFLPPVFQWSPCSSTLAYVIESPPTGSELFLASISQGQVVATSSPSPQTSIGRDFKWVFDDSKIAFRDGEGISMLDVPTGSVNVVSASLGDDLRYQISPDAEHIAMLTSTDELHVGSTDGGDPPPLLSENLTVFDNSWLPDSSGVVFRAAAAYPGRPELYVSPLVGSLRRLSGEFSEEGQGLVLEPVRASPDSSRLLYLADQEVPGAFELHMADLHNAATPNRRLNADITPGLLVPEGEVFSAEWSPDGTMVVYHATQDVGDRPDLYLVDVSLEPPSAPVVLNSGLANTVGVSYYQRSPRALQP